MDNTIRLNKNEVVSYLKKKPADFTKDDIIKFIEDNDIEMVNFMYPAGDGRLKTLNFVNNSCFPGLLHFEKFHSCHDAPH